MNEEIKELKQKIVSLEDINDIKFREIARLHQVCQAKDREIIELIRNFAYFTANFPPNFLQDCWKDSGEMLINHLTSKFKARAKDGYISMEGFMRFFFDLDGDNQRKLIEWTCNHYRMVNKKV